MTKQARFRSTFFLSFFFLATACIPEGSLLTTRSTSEYDAKGDYILILYGGQNIHDFKTVAILDRENDNYRIVPFGANFNYRTFKGLTGQEAYEKAFTFLSNQNDFRNVEKRSIIGPDGDTIIGYEIRPFYHSFTVGRLGDVMKTSFVLRPDNTVQVYVSLKHRFEDSQFMRPDTD